MKFGCCILNAEDIAQVKKAGYDFYEFSGAKIAAMNDDEFKQLVSLSRKLDMPCLGFNNYCNGVPAIVGDSFSAVEASEYARKLSLRGKTLGIRTMGIGAPAARQLPPSYPLEKADRQCMEFLSLTAEAAAANGQHILFEAVNQYLCDYAVYTLDAVVAVKRASISNLAVVLDFYHMQLMGETLADAEIAIPYLQHVHFSTSGENLYRGFPKCEHQAEYRNIITWLKSRGYNRTASIEPSRFNYDEACNTLTMLKSIDKETEAL